LANLQGQLATESLKFLKDKVEKAKALDELDSIATLVQQQQEDLGRHLRIVRPEDLFPAKPLLRFSPCDFKSSLCNPLHVGYTYGEVSRAGRANQG
jgi:hypothetical protein